MTTQYIAELDKIRERDLLFQPTDYKETFDAFCISLIATDLLEDCDKILIRGLLERWETNKKRRC